MGTTQEKKASAKVEKVEKKARVRGPSTEERYGVERYQSYTSAPENPKLQVPPKGNDLYAIKGHTTFDPLMVEEIDRDGPLARVTLMVWSDPDSGTLWIIEGRGNYFNALEVNRRRRERGDKTIVVFISNLPVSRERAVEYVRLMNHHREQVRLGLIASDAFVLWKRGTSFERIAEILHITDSERANEKWIRKAISLQHAIPEVVAAVEKGYVSLTKARRFGGKDLEGKERLSAAEQKKLLAEMLDKKGHRTVTSVPTPARRRFASVLSEDTIDSFEDPKARTAARVLERALVFLDTGDMSALDAWPELQALATKVLAGKAEKESDEGAPDETASADGPNDEQDEQEEAVAASVDIVDDGPEPEALKLLSNASRNGGF